MTRNDELIDLRLLDVSAIDLDAAARHFDLPIDEQFESDDALAEGLGETKQQMIALFEGEAFIEIWRAMEIDADWTDSLRLGSPVGRCWAWDEDGAITGSNVSSASDYAVMLSGRVAPGSVDWSTTVAMNTFHEAEKEIVIHRGADVLLDRVHRLRSGEVLFESDRGLPAVAQTAVEAIADHGRGPVP